MDVRGRIESALTSIVRVTNGSEVSWIVGGSAGLMLRGLKLSSEPRDLDIYSDDADFDRLYDMLQPFAVDKPLLDESGIYRSKLCHFHIDGVSVELVGGFVVKAHGCRYETEVATLLLPYSDSVYVSEDATVPVVPLAHELWFNVLRDRPDRSQLIIEAYRADEKSHQEALAQLEKRNHLSEEAIRHVHDWIIGEPVSVLL
ncbi:MAG: nucleotidyltransferase domain-containing protein [Candidatus Pristimantibacillus sp.]